MESTTPRTFLRIADLLASHGYRIGQQIGEGAYSKVHTTEKLSDGSTYAVKIVDLSKVRTGYLKHFMPHELDVITLLKHRNVVETVQIIQDKTYVLQIMEYASKGDVLRMIQQHGFIAEEKAKSIFKDVAAGVQYLHDLNIAHRDLKCENILIFEDNRAVVSDFGFVKNLDGTSSTNLCRTFCGSTAYASPEVLRGLPYDPKMNDVWSIGVVLFTMLSGTIPFDDGNVTRMVQKQQSRDYTFPARVVGQSSCKARQLVYEILDPDTNSRPTVKTVLESAWLI
ncbi:testis-specific serine/threonine-protein kinase 2-like [Dreissena polymorpha]|uniref:Protein kinase domain-containing protein n=1 Tax=Dreissena polymorpha TaxID=45954 RepID=A0A9D4RAM7_DREPO|nr:testis-specific serine/threonine-protein kinase 2-like [Dreissena polymorpha]KAH3861346.1 hypothetical protein DPMN_024273 [Dreissena polymorpha]